MKAIQRLFGIVIAALVCYTLPAQAHKPSDSYLSLKVIDNRIEGQWDIALRDLDFAIGIDADGNGELTWDELRARHQEIAAYALSRLTLGNLGATCPLTVAEHLIDDHTDGAYAVMRLSATCPARIDTLDMRYKLLFDVDPQHKGLLKLDYLGNTSAAIFSPDRASQQFALAQASQFKQFIEYARHGVWHIWIGFDHILFLLSLLLPAVLSLRGKEWQAAESFRSSSLDVLRIVSAFTLAHSLTLTLASLQIIALPSRWVESAIAASVVIAALNNVVPIFQGQRWIAAFVFGLIHGFGFAGVLTDLGLPQSSLILSLIGFNLGVELGQLAIVAAFLPIAHMVRGTWLYRSFLRVGGSACITLVAAIWLAERSLDLKLI